MALNASPPPSSFSAKRPDSILLPHILLAAVLLILAAIQMGGQPILADEWDFYRSATNWAQQRHLIPHPQAYVHLLQLSFRLFGQSITSARIPGIVSTLINLLLIPMLVYAFWDDKAKARPIAVLAIWFYTLNPMTPQNMVLIDIDNTLLIPIQLGILWIWKRTQHWPTQRRIPLLGLAIAAALWTKLPTPIILIGTVGFFTLLKGDAQQRRRETLTWLAASFAGTLLFLATFTLYGELTGFTFAYFAPSFSQLPGSSSGSLQAILLRAPQTVGLFILWLSLPVTLLLAIVIARTLKRLRYNRLDDRDLLVFYTAAILLTYALIIAPAWGYPRYQAPATPTIAISVAALITAARDRTLGKTERRSALLGFLVALYLFTVVGDPLWPLYDLTFETTTGDLAQRMARGFTLVAGQALPLLIALTASILPISSQWKKEFYPRIVALLGILAFAYMATTTAIQVNADYSTRYRYTYPYADLLQTIALVEQRDGYTLAIKDVLYAADVPGEEIYTYVCATCSPQTLLDKIRERPVAALVWTTKEDNRFPHVTQNPQIRVALQHCYQRSDHGPFIIYLRDAATPCTLTSFNLPGSSEASRKVENLRNWTLGQIRLH